MLTPPANSTLPAGVPPGAKPAIVWGGPGTMPQLVWMAAAPKNPAQPK
jgi:hypothetical protein